MVSKVGSHDLAQNRNCLGHALHGLNEFEVDYVARMTE